MHGQQNVKTGMISYFLCFLTMNPSMNFFKRSQLGAHYFLVYLVQLLYSTLYGWLWPPLQSEKYQFRIDTVRSPDDGHIVARNM